MLATALLTSSFLLLSNTIEGGSCDFIAGSVRVYKVQESSILRNCPPPSQIDANSAANSAQNAFLIQSLPNVLTSQGFRSTLSSYSGKAAVLAVISATKVQRDVILNSTDPRYYTMSTTPAQEILISVVGTQLAFYYSYGGTIDSSKTKIVDLAPTDIVNGVMQLDTRLTYNQAGSSPNLISLTVCSQRGAGGCHAYSLPNAFGTQSPDIFLGSVLQYDAASAMRARYCNLPAFGVQHVSGYTTTCPGPVGAALAGEWN